MFCRLCGNANGDRNFHCTSCGSSIKEENIIKSFNIQEEKHSFCQKCGNQSQGRYCTNCGNSTYIFKIHQGLNFNINTENLKSITSTVEKKIKTNNVNLEGMEDIITNIKKTLNNRVIIKDSIISATKMLVIGVIISFIFFMLLINIDGVGSFYDDIKEVQENFKYTSDFKVAKFVPNALDLYGLSFQNSLNFKANGRMWGENLGKLKGIIGIKILILLVIPIITILISQIKLFKDQFSTKSHIINYITSSILFSIMLNGILIFNGKKIIISEGSENFFKVYGNFNLFMGLIKVSIITFIIQLLLSVFIKKENLEEIVNTKNSEYILGLNTYAKNMFFYTLFYVIVIFVTILFLDIGSEEKIHAVLSFILWLPNLIVSIWLLIFGGKFGINISRSALEDLPYFMYELLNEMRGFLTDISLFDSWKLLRKVREFSGGELTDFILFYIFIILIVVAIVFIVLESVKSLSESKYFINLSFLSGAVSIVNYVLAILSRNQIKVSGNSQMLKGIGLEFFKRINQLTIGFDLINIIIFTFAFVFIVGVIHYFAKKQNIYIAFNNFIENNGTTIKIGYLVLTLLVMLIIKAKLNDSLGYYNNFF